MSLIVKVPEKSIWEEICKDFESRRPPFPDAAAEAEADAEDAQSVSTTKSDYNPSKHTPVFYGKLFQKVPLEDGPSDFDPAVSHPATVGYALLDRPSPTPPPAATPLPDKQRCSPREYLEAFVFPTLLPAMEEMLRRAGEERCFDRKRTKFNANDFLTEYLYARNPNQRRDPDTRLEDIPFVKDEWERNPRPPLPLSVLLSDEDAVQIIQNHWRGFLVRRDPEVQELRQWQREWRETSRDARRSVSEFWDQRMGPDTEQQELQQEQQQELQQEQQEEQRQAEQHDGDDAGDDDDEEEEEEEEEEQKQQREDQEQQQQEQPAEAGDSAAAED